MALSVLKYHLGDNILEIAKYFRIRNLQILATKQISNLSWGKFEPKGVRHV